MIAIMIPAVPKNIFRVYAMIINDIVIKMMLNIKMGVERLGSFRQAIIDKTAWIASTSTLNPITRPNNPS